MTKANKMACEPSEDSDQPGHPPTLIRVFAVRIKKAWVLSNPLSTEQRLIRLGRSPGGSESSLGTYAILLVLLCTGSNVAVFADPFLTGLVETLQNSYNCVAWLS